MSYPYNTQYFPPFPELEVILSLPGEGRIGPLPMQIDTGADNTIIPIKYLEQLGMHPVDYAFLCSQWGERRLVDIYLLDIQIGQLTLPNIEVVGDNISRETILGRNVLNELILLLDGPSELTDILPKRPRIPK